PEDTSYAQLRRTQSEELFAEIHRLCGLEEDGQVPDTCVIDDTDPAGPAGSRENAVAQLVELAEKAPEDSRPLLVDQAIALADGNATLPEAPDEDLLDEARSEEHTSELQSRFDLVCRLLLVKENHYINTRDTYR